MSDDLTGLLRSYRPPQPRADLADRVAAAAMAHRQDPALPPSRAGRGRRSRWLVRPLVAGVGALGLAVSSAVAASLAGFELPQPVQKLVEQLPLVGKQRGIEPAPQPAVVAPQPVRRADVAPPRPAPAPTPPVQAEAPSPTPRFDEMRRRVEARRAAGLPTPGADAMERRIARRRAAGLPIPTPDQIERRLERQAYRQDAGGWRGGPEGRGGRPMWRARAEALRHELQALPPAERAERVRELRAQRRAFLERRERRMGMPPLPPAGE